jgi:hypothetical protein
LMSEIWPGKLFLKEPLTPRFKKPAGNIYCVNIY